MIKKLLFFVICFMGMQTVLSQEILATVTAEALPVHLLRKEDSPVLQLLPKETFLYAEQHNAAMVKVLFYAEKGNVWTEGYLAQRGIHYLSNGTKAEKTRFIIAYLTRFNEVAALKKNDLQPAFSLNLMIDMILEQTCVYKNTVIARLFMQSLLAVYDTLDEKQLYAVEELYHCQKELVEELVASEKNTFARTRIQQLIKEF